VKTARPDLDGDITETTIFSAAGSAEPIPASFAQYHEEASMTLILSRALRLAVMTACASACQPHHAVAQVPDPSTQSSLLTVTITVPADGVVDVTDIRGKTLKGVLGRVTSEVVEVIVEGETRAVVARDVQRIRWRHQDSWVTGALIGAGIGAIPGVYYLISDPNECAGLCPEEYALIGVGAIVGALVDKAITKKVTVYEKPAKGAGRSVALTTVLTGTRLGVHVTVRF
jgi:hypothetical protein